ncbi:DUF2066 domain-containing protein [Sinimarinibacterium sp. CAU 1509]|uniref:DUF2066 domain-containing protein n=1 Tax=Sinimarinibacterium sp. CAU 1509 TaxID=2562283 RepID=UPI00146E55F2|nr:DUF2066 domain-containing protein [Sinimarinibacterium sp. CAU 1509]
MRTLFLLIGLCVTGIALAQSQAPGTGNPYEARVPVTDQSAGTRDAALREALATIVNRVGGDGAATQAGSLIAQAPQLVQRYGYDKDETGATVLVAAFDPRTVDSRVKGLGLPVWGVYAAEVEDIQLMIRGVSDRSSYLKVMALLRGLPSVRRVDVISAKADGLALSVRSEGGASRLNGALLTSGTLTQDYSTGTSELVYRVLATAP